MPTAHSSDFPLKVTVPEGHNFLAISIVSQKVPHNIGLKKLFINIENFFIKDRYCYFFNMKNMELINYNRKNMVTEINHNDFMDLINDFMRRIITKNSIAGFLYVIFR